MQNNTLIVDKLSRIKYFCRHFVISLNIQSQFLKSTKSLFTSAIALSVAVIAIISACSSQKDTASNRALQNLSAKYNLIYNSNVLLETFEDNTFQAIKNDYESVLPLYYAPFADFSIDKKEPSKELGEINNKARTIIADKKLSNYLDEAYMLLGKSSFYDGSYFNALEYFDYVTKAFRANPNTYLNGLNWKVRSLMQLGEDKQAMLYLDTIKAVIPFAKNFRSEAFATIAQMNIYKQNYTEAITNLENAQKAGTKQYYRIRWNYILGQLHEYVKDYKNSLKFYRKVERSNAPFEMYFNAKLSNIRINDLLNGGKTDRQKQLLALIKDDKNADFIDQIYYEIGEDFYADGILDKAITNYRLSTTKSTTNQTQKALSYLKIADINFKELSDYVSAKLYYDSAVALLPTSYPGFEAIVKKAENLNYLKERYEIIKLQDTLQAIAKLPEPDRKPALAAYFHQDVSQLNNASSSTTNQKASQPNTSVSQVGGNSSFYFGNSLAVARGVSDFRTRWGNRKLADDWRQSVKSSAQNTQQAQNAIGDNSGLPQDPDKAISVPKQENTNVLAYLDSIPLTGDQKEKSNLKIIQAFTEIGTFYQQELNDKQEAIKVYEELLRRFPYNSYADAAYYSLYIDYKGLNNLKSEMYKNLILTKFPSSNYAKIILDPSFSVKQSALEATLQKDYNEVYNLFTQRQYTQVISGVEQTTQRFPGNTLEPQYSYLRAISIGHLKPVDALLAEFGEILIKYPTDRIIKPLVMEHLAYINEHLEEFKKRPVALTDFDANEPRFIPMVDEPKQAAPIAASPISPTVANPPTKTDVVEKPSVSITNQITDPDIPAGTAKSQTLVQTPQQDNLFSAAASEVYYAVIWVNTTDYSLSSSRFGIGQFNRSNYSGDNLRHSLREFDEDQIVYIGDFQSFNDAKNYEVEIIKQLSRIMKVPAANYSTFVISKENLDKLKNRETLNRYQNFIRANEPQNR